MNHLREKYSQELAQIKSSGFYRNEEEVLRLLDKLDGDVEVSLKLLKGNFKESFGDKFY